MLFIKREDLDILKGQIEQATIKLRTYDNDLPGFRLDDDRLEAVALLALGMRVSMELGRPDVVQPTDVQHLSGMTPIYELPNLD